jgi:hypothetical protein
MKTPMGVVVLVEALGAVGLARAAINQCGGKRGGELGLQPVFFIVEDRQLIYL